MLLVGLPLICVLTFQLVKETKIAQLNGELTAIEGKRAEREHKLAELAAKQTSAKAELQESLTRNDAVRQDAISLTDYQKKELSEVESRQATIIQQFNADTEQLTKTIADLRARCETEVGRATKWNAEEARIENAYKAKKAEYDNANFLKRQLMREPVNPGVPPERESNTILKPTLVAELDDQIKSKEAELLAVNNKRRDRVAQVDADARRVREQFDTR